jgi:ubiquitin-activating enzyme E1
MSEQNKYDLNERQDRQIRTYGKDACQKLNNSQVIVVGLSNNLGTEIVKNLVLGGVKHLFLCDNYKITEEDINNGFYYTNDSLNKNRAEYLKNKVQELNPYTNISLLDYNNLDESINKMDNTVLVLVNESKDISIKYNDMCRSRSNFKMVWIRSTGISGIIFVDGGNSHKVFDKSGENIEPVQIGSITSDGIIECAINCSHDFQNGDVISLSNLEGSKILNLRLNNWKIKVLSKVKFQLLDYNYNCYLTNGTATLVKEYSEFKFESLRDQYDNKKIVGFNPDESNNIINIYDELYYIKYVDKQNLDPWGIDMDNLSSKFKGFEQLVRSILTEIPSVSSFIGSVASSEIIKLVSYKYTPINQWWTWIDKDLIPKEKPTSFGESKISKLFGLNFERKINNLNVLMVGCGALGCEWLKIASLMNMSVNGEFIITDPDHIETSNLSRQFLFRSSHVKKSKSIIAAKSINEINDKINISPLEHKISSDNMDIVNTVFDKRNIIINALDNIKARRFVDNECFKRQLPLFESGTMGLKGNTQPVIPFLTETYGNTSDPSQEKQFPICTIKSFPNQILHTITWARDNFDFFRRVPENINNFKSNHNFLEELSGFDKEQAKEDIKLFEIDYSFNDWNDCVQLAVNMWAKFFRDDILQLLNSFPPDSRTKDGRLFWSEGKRCPIVMNYDIDDNLVIGFIESTTHLISRCCNLNDKFSKNDLTYYLRTNNIIPKDFKLKTDLKIAENDNELKELNETENTENEVILPDNLNISRTYYPHEFEKDDDTNWHVSYLTYASNCRARIYGIPRASFYDTKGIAGKIIPAVATTTSAVVGLISMEMIKYCLGVDDIDYYQSYFVNLADNTIISANPNPSPIRIIGKNKINSWKKFDFNEDVTLGEFINIQSSEFDTKINSVLYGNSILYMSYFENGNIGFKLSKIFNDKFHIDINKKAVELVIGSEDEYDLPSINVFL